MKFRIIPALTLIVAFVAFATAAWPQQPDDPLKDFSKPSPAEHSAEADADRGDKQATPSKKFDPFADDAFANAAPDESDKAAAEAIKKSGLTAASAVVGMDVPGLTRRLRDAIVTVTQQGREGGVRGTGTGFVVDAEQGLIATNLHVIGEGRPVRVELSDGTEHRVLSVNAWDRKLDLAVIRIDPTGLKLKALELADSDLLEQGAPIVAFGNPRGLKFSVVQGVASAMRDSMEDSSGARVEFGFPMIQIAIPVEMGNSGGPIVDAAGRVLGLVTIKWLMTDNLGFAVPSNSLKPLLENPNPVPMDRWMTIGALDPARWRPLMGGNWSQRAGVIKVTGSGSGFGGRSVCLSQRDVPDAPYEVATEVRLDDEAGAAGLVFACQGDAGEVHYGFYPSAGQLRLTRFEGPDVYSWTILEQKPSDAYRPGDWNHLRVRVEEETITAFVNGEQVIQLRDGVLRGGKVGLCKFRQTAADFRHFKVASDLSPKKLSADLLTELKSQIEGIATGAEADEKLLDALSAETEVTRTLIEEKAVELEQRAKELRELTLRLHHRRVTDRMTKVMANDEAGIDLLEAGLLIAWLDNPDLDVDAYLEDFDQLGADAAEAVASIESGREKDSGMRIDPLSRVERLRDFVFAENGFHGSRSQYYNHSNSYLNEVLDDREGLPITLAVVFLELADRAGVEGLSGLALPGHFMVAWHPEAKAADKKSDEGKTEKNDGESEAAEKSPPPDAAVEDQARFIDVFDGGVFLTPEEANIMVREITGTGIQPEHLEPPSKEDIVLRMLRNLVGLEMDAGRPEVARPYIDLILEISPEEAGERFSRALLRYQGGETAGAKSDLEWLMENRPPGIRIDRLQELYEQLE